MAGFWNMVEQTILHMGGTRDHMAMLSQAVARHAIEKLAETAIREFPVVYELVGEPTTFGEAIRAGNYHEVSGLAANAKVYGAALGSPRHKVQLFNRNAMSRITIEEVYNEYRGRIAGLSELLLFGSSHPKIQLLISIQAIWRDASDNYWNGTLYNVGGERRLDIAEVPGTGTCSGVYKGSRLLFLA